MRRAIVASALLAMSLTVAVPMAGGAAPVFWKNYRQPAKVEPNRIDINYSTGFASATRLNDWEGWGGPRATSSGILHLNTCKPYCAAGNYEAVSGTVTLYKVRHCGRQRRYVDIEIEVKGKPAATWGSDCRGAQIVDP